MIIVRISRSLCIRMGVRPSMLRGPRFLSISYDCQKSSTINDSYFIEICIAPSLMSINIISFSD